MEDKIEKPNTYEVWKSQGVAKTFLEGVRSAIPLATEQIEVILRLIRLTQTQVNSFLDLGCGNGILGKAIYQQYPDAKGIFVDISESMLKAAESSFETKPDALQFILQDFGNSEWVNSVTSHAPFDVIVSGFAIHHQPNTRKREIYQEIYSLLKPGGIFLNLEHVASKSSWGEAAFDQLFVDSLYAFHKSKGSEKTRQEIDQEYYNRSDKTANILAAVEVQCHWLSEIGFVEVDCFMKLFEIALFGGIRPHKAT